MSLKIAIFVISQLDYSDINAEIYGFEIIKDDIKRIEFVSKINGYYVTESLITNSNEEIAIYIFNPDDYKSKTCRHNVNFRFTKVEIDTYYEIDDDIKYKGEEILANIQESHLIYSYEYPFQNDNTTRRKFVDFYEITKDFVNGDCIGKWGKFIPFIDKIIKLYGISNSTVLNLRRNSQRLDRKYYLGEYETDNSNTMIVFENGKLYVPELFSEYFNLRNEQIIILPVAINDERGHLNVLLFNKLSKEFERFEPNGNYFTKLDESIIDVFSKLLPEWRYIRPLDYCPLEGPQIVIGEEGCPHDSGFCVTLSIMYALLRIRNSEYTREEVIYAMNQLGPFTLRKFNTYVDLLVPDL